MNIAVIGCGRHVSTTLSRYLADLEGDIVWHCVDRNHQRARSVGRRLGQSVAYNDIGSLPYGQLSGSIVALPPADSFSVTTQMIERHIPCFVEKPVAATTSQIAELIDLSQANAVKIMTGFNFRWSFASSVMRECCGDEHYVMGDIAFMSRHPSGPEWGVANVIEAFCRHNAVHVFDLAHYMFGPSQLVNVACHCASVNTFALSIVLSHDAGHRSRLILSNKTNRFRLSFNVYTNNMTLVSSASPNEVSILRSDGATDRTPERLMVRQKDSDYLRSGYGYYEELAMFVRGLHDSHPYSPGLREAHAASVLCDNVISEVKRIRV